MSDRPLVPRDWKTTNAIHDAKKKKPLVFSAPHSKQYPVFNGSQNNPNNKKRPITLPKIEIER